MRSTYHLPNQKSVHSCLQVNPSFLLMSSLALPASLCCEEPQSFLVGIVQPLTKNLHGFDSHGSGVLFKPTRGPFVTRELGILMPASIHRLPVLFVRSTPFSILVIPIA